MNLDVDLNLNLNATVDVVIDNNRGSAMEAAAALDTMRVMKLIDDSRSARGIEILEGNRRDAHQVDLKTSMTTSKVAFRFRFKSTSTSTSTSTSRQRQRHVNVNAT